MDKNWIALVGPEVGENLGLRYLASALSQAGFHCEILAFNSQRDYPRILRSLLESDPQPFLIGLSLAFQWRAQDFLALAMALREHGYPGHITAGGHFATFATEDLLQNFVELDSLCRFEAEATIVELARALVAGSSLSSVSGLALRDGNIVKLTPPRAFPQLGSLSWPDRRGEPAACFGHRIAPLIGSRGCYGNCSYCCIAAWYETGSSGKRFRLREVDDIADEVAQQHHQRGVEIFVFEDDNFFLPRPEQSLERIHALADALEVRGVSSFATVFKARPNDVKLDVFEPLVQRLHCIRAFVGFETNSRSGLVTLARHADCEHNAQALEVVRTLGLYIAFNLLLFDPDTRLSDIQSNIAFMKSVADYPFCVGRVELYAGTPLLRRMQLEKRCTGDFMQYNYTLADQAVERVFHIFMRCLGPRNFDEDSPVVRMWLLRFDVEACRFFHPTTFREEWRSRAVGTTRRMSLDTAATLQTIVEHCQTPASRAEDVAFAADLEKRCRALDVQTMVEAEELAIEMSSAVGHRASLCEVRRFAENPIEPSSSDWARLGVPRLQKGIEP